MLCEPVPGSTGRLLESGYVSIEVAAWQDHQTLGLVRGVESRDRQLGRCQVIPSSNDHAEGGRSEVRKVATRLVLGEHFDAPKSHLVAPGGRARLTRL